jgi:hypothetical protein
MLFFEHFAIRKHFNVNNKTHLSFKKSKKLKNLARLPLTNNQEDLNNSFGNKDFIKHFLESKKSTDQDKHVEKARTPAMFDDKIQELAGI